MPFPFSEERNAAYLQAAVETALVWLLMGKAEESTLSKIHAVLLTCTRTTVLVDPNYSTCMTFAACTRVSRKFDSITKVCLLQSACVILVITSVDNFHQSAMKRLLFTSLRGPG